MIHLHSTLILIYEGLRAHIREITKKRGIIPPKTANAEKREIAPYFFENKGKKGESMKGGRPFSLPAISKLYKTLNFMIYRGEVRMKCEKIAF